MKLGMGQEDIKLVESKIREFEQNTGCELLLVVARESDAYPAAPYRFGIIAAFLFTLTFSHYFEFEHAELWPLFFIGNLLLFIWLGHFPVLKRLALLDLEVEREGREKAIEIFHTEGSSRVAHNVTAMIMVSLLEHRIEVLVDQKLREKLTQDELDDLVLIMQKHFRSGNMTLGFTESITSLEKKILKDFGGKVNETHPGELKDTIIFI